MKKHKLSAVVTTFNNADTLKRCLQSAAELADEIVVLDSYSDDASLTIASDFSAKIHQQTFQGFGAQKTAAICLASNDWILLLDADEALSAALQEEIAALKSSGFKAPGYRLRRREWLANKKPITEHGRWQHRWVKLTDHLRLFHRQQIEFTSHPVHAAPYSSAATELLQADLLHWGDAPFSRRLEKAYRYASLYSVTKSRNTWIKPYFAPVWAFIQDFFIRRYFFDSYLGFHAAKCSFWSSYWKYKLSKTKAGPSE